MQPRSCRRRCSFSGAQHQGLAMFDTLLATLGAGGPVVGLLFAMSVAALAIILLKIWQFSSVGIGRYQVARDALSQYQQGRLDDALATADTSRNPVAKALARAFRGRLRGLDEGTVREEVARAGQADLFALRGHLRTLELIAALAPLLGLFGTVLGMIEAFRQLESAGSQVNPAVLSGGIWQALLTTAAGLGVAMPVLAALTWLERRVDALAHEMNMLVTQVFTEDLTVDRGRMEMTHGRGQAALQPAE